VPILILTGNDGVVDRVRAKMVGATDFLSKTISHDQLLAALAKHLVKAE
jgi:two-component system, chemotaxis family, response regulator PixG